MSNQKFSSLRPYILPIALVFQIGILVGMVLLAMHPLIEGKEIRLLVEARDPRDLFRGDYVVLQYQFSSLDLDSIANNLDPAKNYRFGDILFLELQKQETHYNAVGLWRTPPQRGTFMKVLVEHYYKQPREDDSVQAQRVHGTIRLRAGIEEFFADTETARRLDSLINARGETPTIRVVSHVMLTDNGAVRIKEVRYNAEH